VQALGHQVADVAKANDTEISVSSELGKGTEFTLKFNTKA
jgi:hypothetical protein